MRFGFVGGAKRCPYPSIDFVLRGIKLSSLIFTSYNPLFTATMSGPAPAQTDATPCVQFEGAATIAQGIKIKIPNSRGLSGQPCFTPMML